MSNPFSPLAKDALLQGRYRIVGLIGRGGMGAVYQAREILTQVFESQQTGDESRPALRVAVTL